MKVSFVTPSIPERAAMLEETIESVARMTPVGGWDVEHLWLVDSDYDGCSVTTNRLARMAKGEWLVPIADDDLVLPWFLSDHASASGEADVVYAPPLVTGSASGGEEQFWGEPPNIPAVAMIRKDLWDAAGGYNEEVTQTEDLLLFGALQTRGARFVRSDRHPWIYRFHGANKSRGYVSSHKVSSIVE
jgi:hypothetical protein